MITLGNRALLFCAVAVTGLAQVPSAPARNPPAQSPNCLLTLPSTPPLLPPAQVGAVVVGFDRFVNYYKIQIATLCLRENPGCLFIATNLDAVTHLTDAQEWAGAGSMVGALRGSTKREPTVVGKPADFMLSDIATHAGIDRSEICMVGDRLDTDIAFGKDGGLSTILVLSGVTSEEELLSPNNKIHPDAYLDSLADVLRLSTA
ncbi:hypothetical protein ACKKBF_B17455 [Auxenochlorella protothecoides x Auxenochlorella symbiontica]